MRRATSPAVDNLPGLYVPDVVERTGRKLKMEYVGMASVFAVIALGSYAAAPSWGARALATGGSFFLFLGLKKKTRDHLLTSFLMFAAAALAAPAVAAPGGAAPVFLFGACAWALEGYLEKRRNRIYTLPVILGSFAWVSPLWPAAACFVAAYLFEPRPEAPGLRRKLAIVAAVAALVVAAVLLARDAAPRLARAPDGALLGLTALVAVPVLLALVAYRRHLRWPHALGGVVFAAAAPVDEQLVGFFGIAGTIALAATVFRDSAGSSRWRHALKHAEWYFFWAIFVTALGLLLFR
jgi:hypothetical protein